MPSAFYSFSRDGGRRRYAASDGQVYVELSGAAALLLVICPLYIHVGENRHGNLGTYSRDGEGDNPLLSARMNTHECGNRVRGQHHTA